MNPERRVKREATYEDILALPEHVVGEIIDGELVVSPRPAPRHALASSVLGGELVPTYGRGRGGPGGWLILFEPELHLGRHVLVPDLAGWRRERQPRLPEAAYFEVAPDWVCEVLSPGTGLVDRTRKQRIYREHGVEWLWFVEPGARTVEVWHRSGADWVLALVSGGTEKARLPPFDAVELELGALWDEPPPSEPTESP